MDRLRWDSEVYEEYLKSAKTHVEEYKKSESKIAAEKQKETEKYYAGISKALEKKYKDNKEKWVNGIVNGVLNYNN